MSLHDVTDTLIGLSPLIVLLAVGVVVGLESTGLPLPGEITVIAAAIISHDGGRIPIEAVIAAAAAGAILGDNLGYLIGRTGGRKLLTHPGPLYEHRVKGIERGEVFFDRHGPKAVFLGRWFSGLRIAAAWLAGMNRMHWATFLGWNAAGGILWATAVGLAAFFAGPVIETILRTAGLGGLGLLVVAAIVAWLVHRRRERRREREPDADEPDAARA